MKKYILYILCLTGCLWTLSSCTDYLDKAPSSGLTEDEVFGNLTNFRQFFDGVYNAGSNLNIKCAYNAYFQIWDQKASWDCLTDLEDQARMMRKDEKQATAFGQSVYISDTKRRPLLYAMFRVIRRCNIALQKVDQIADATDADKEDLRGQAYLCRGFATMAAVNVWGGMPHIVAPIGVDDEWDIPRLSPYDSYLGIAADMDSAYTAFQKAGLVRRDPGPGEVGNLNDTYQDRPNGVAAKALKSRALLYAASPLNNRAGQAAWEKAAEASWEAIRIALQYNYVLLPASDYYQNNYGAKYTNEQIWAYYLGSYAYNNGALQGMLSGPMAGQVSYWAGWNPTQNLVDMYETKWGDPLNTEEDRARAAALGHYNEQNPYANRDPRFESDIIYNQKSMPWSSYDASIGENKNVANIFYYVDPKTGKTSYSSMTSHSYVGYTHTGYMQSKLTGNMSVRNKVTTLMTSSIIRLAELYLNYAEAANEAYGPDGSAPGATLTAAQALNVVRNRVNMPDIGSRYTASRDLFRERVKNERTVELNMEGHRWVDVRRWKDAPTVYAGPLYGMDIQYVGKSREYPTGFKYTRVELEAARQVKWKDFMWYFPFNTSDYYKFKNFDTSSNPLWQ